MKRNILFLFWMIGLVMFEWGCIGGSGGGCGDYEPNYYRINGIEKLDLLTIQKSSNGYYDYLFPKPGDTIEFGKYKINLEFESELIASHRKAFGSELIAAPCPSVPGQQNDLELDSMEVIAIQDGVESPLDSIGISSYWHYRAEMSLDLWDSTNVQILNNVFGTGNDFELTLLQAPDSIVTQSYKVKLFLNTGDIFEGETLPITITP